MSSEKEPQYIRLLGSIIERRIEKDARKKEGVAFNILRCPVDRID